MLNHIQHKEIEYDHVSHELEVQKSKQNFRLWIILILAISTITLSVSLYQSTLLSDQRKKAYAVLMEKYEAEKKAVGAKERQAQVRNQEVPTELTASKEDPLMENLIRYYQDEKPYLDPKLKLETVLKKLGVTERVLANSLKNYGEENFHSFTNRYRVEVAIKMMENPAYHKYKIETIAAESGFGSRMSFYNAFIQFTGVRPSYFRTYLEKREQSRE